jgi:periplasmic protein TonB
MKNLIVFLLILFAIIKDSAAQKTRLVTEKKGRFDPITTSYYVLADDRSIKHGSYDEFRPGKPMVEGFYKMNKKDSVWKRYAYNGQLASERTYAEDVKTGVWKFYKMDGSLESQYDFVNKKAIYPKWASFSYNYLNDNNEWVKEKTDVEPFWLTSSAEWQSFLLRYLEYPEEAQDKKIQGSPMIEITIDEDGRPIAYGIARSLHPLLDNSALNVVKLFEPEFIPGEKNGKRVKMKITMMIVFRLEGDF